MSALVLAMMTIVVRALCLVVLGLVTVLLAHEWWTQTKEGWRLLAQRIRDEKEGR